MTGSHGDDDYASDTYGSFEGHAVSMEEGSGILLLVTVIWSLVMIFLIPFCVAVREKVKGRRHRQRRMKHMFWQKRRNTLIATTTTTTGNNAAVVTSTINAATTNNDLLKGSPESENYCPQEETTATEKQAADQDSHKNISNVNEIDDRDGLLKPLSSSNTTTVKHPLETNKKHEIFKDEVHVNEESDDDDDSSDAVSVYYGLRNPEDVTILTDSTGSLKRSSSNLSKTINGSWWWLWPTTPAEEDRKHRTDDSTSDMTLAASLRTGAFGRRGRCRQARIQGAARILHSSLPPPVICIGVPSLPSPPADEELAIAQAVQAALEDIEDSYSQHETVSLSPTRSRSSLEELEGDIEEPLQHEAVSLSPNRTRSSAEGGRSRSPRSHSRSISHCQSISLSQSTSFRQSIGQSRSRSRSQSRDGNQSGSQSLRRSRSQSRGRKTTSSRQERSLRRQRRSRSGQTNTRSSRNKHEKQDALHVYDPTRTGSYVSVAHSTSFNQNVAYDNNDTTNSPNQENEKCEPLFLDQQQEPLVEEINQEPLFEEIQQEPLFEEIQQERLVEEIKQEPLVEVIKQAPLLVDNIGLDHVLSKINQALEKDLAFDFDDELNSLSSLQGEEVEENKPTPRHTSDYAWKKDLEKGLQLGTPKTIQNHVDAEAAETGEYVELIDTPSTSSEKVTIQSHLPTTATISTKQQFQSKDQQMEDKVTYDSSNDYYELLEPHISSHKSEEEDDLISKVAVNICCGKRPWWRFLCSRPFRRKVAKCASWDNEMKSLLKLAMPFTLQTLSSHLFGLMEVAVIGRFLGTQTLAAYYAVGFVFSLTCMLMEGAHSSLYTLCSHAVGAKKHGLAGQMVQLAVVFYQLLLIPMAIIVFHYMEHIISWLGFDQEVTDIASSYARVGLVSTFIYPIDEALYYLLEVTGHEVYCATMSLSGSVASFLSVLIAALVFPNMSLFGIGVIHLALEIAYLYANVTILRQKGWLDDYLSGMTGSFVLMNGQVVRLFLKQAIPLSLGYVMAYGEWEILFVFAGFMGPAYVAVWGLVGDLWGALEAVGLATSDAAEIRISNLLGSNQPNRARYCAHKSLLVSVVVAIVCSLPIYLLSSKIPAWFTKDETLQFLFKELIPYVCIGNVTMMFGSVSWTLLGAQGRYGLATAMGCVGSWGVTIPLSAIFTYGIELNLPGLASAVVIGYACSGSLNSFFLVRSNWEKLSLKIQRKNKEEEDKWNETKQQPNQEHEAIPHSISYCDLAWNELPDDVKTGAKMLGFTRTLWDKDQESPLIKTHSWSQLDAEQQHVAKLLGYDPEDWPKDNDNDKKHAYDGHDWDELPAVVQEAAKLLGYNQSMWDKSETPQDLEDQCWTQLTPTLRLAAGVLGYDQEKWNKQFYVVGGKNRSKDNKPQEEPGHHHISVTTSATPR
ncbi:hypothetical protein ACA910_019315 [Epithemia clementina (nom. ined.)]